MGRYTPGRIASHIQWPDFTLRREDGPCRTPLCWLHSNVLVESLQIPRNGSDWVHALPPFEPSAAVPEKGTFRPALPLQRFVGHSGWNRLARNGHHAPVSVFVDPLEIRVGCGGDVGEPVSGSH